MVFTIEQDGQTSAHLAMTGQQRQTIADAFEEGHYAIGISILAGLCDSEGYLPDPVLVRQLLYLSLYPYEPPRENVDGMDLQRAIFPTPAAADAANSLLEVFAARLPPSHLLAALPFYPAIGEARHNSPPRTTFDNFSTSKVVKEAERLAHCRCSWDMLKQGFVPLLNHEARTLPGSPNKRSSFATSSQYFETSLIVGPEAWPVLEWLLHIFERDELEHERTTGVRYSPLLLTQIPDRRSERGLKWDATVPLDIAFFCAEQEKHEVKCKRLLFLLCHLTLSSAFDGLMFINSLATRFSQGYEHIDLLLSFLSDSVRFAVCRALLARPVESERRKRTKTQPVARRKKANNVTTDDTLTSSPNVAQFSEILPPPSQIIDLLSSTWGNDTDAVVIKYHLLRSFFQLQQLVEPASNGSEWASMVQTGTMQEAIETTFESSEDLKDLLLAELSAFS